jgi:hypothetical protein
MRIHTAAEPVGVVAEEDLEIDAVYGGLDGAELTLDAQAGIRGSQVITDDG